MKILVIESVDTSQPRMEKIYAILSYPTVFLLETNPPGLRESPMQKFSAEQGSYLD